MKKGYVFGVFSFLACFLSIVAEPRKNEQILKKHKQMVEWSNQHEVISMNGSDYANYLVLSPREYNAIVLFTDLRPQSQCSFCREVMDEFLFIANAWRHKNRLYNSKLFFVMIDYDKAPDVFSLVDITDPPVIVRFPRTGMPKKGDIMDFYKFGYRAEAIADFVKKRTDLYVNFHRRPQKPNVQVLALLFGVIGVFLYIKRPTLEFLKNETLWTIVSLTIIISMSSGQMWNYMKGARFAGRNNYIHNYSKSQYVFESHIVMSFYTAILVGMIMLNDVGTIKGNAKKKKNVALIGLGIVAFYFTALLYMYRKKDGGYPYSLF